MTETRTFVATQNGSRYLQQLAKHFAHKLTVSFDPAQGSITFPEGVCALAANAEGLEMKVTAADPATAARLADVIDRHLLRFSFREELALNWTPA